MLSTSPRGSVPSILYSTRHRNFNNVHTRELAANTNGVLAEAGRGVEGLRVVYHWT